MANNELSGPLIQLGLFQKIKNWKYRNHNFKFLINPETIGSLCYLHRNKKNIKKSLSAGLVLTCLGGPNKKLSFKKTRDNNSQINKFFQYFKKKKLIELIEYNPLTESNERQYNSPGFNLPVGQISRTRYLTYKEYHTSLDNKNFLNIRKFQDTVNRISNLIYFFDRLSGKLIRKNNFGELFLSKHNLYENKKTNKKISAVIHLLSDCDGKTSILDTIIKYDLDLQATVEALEILIQKKIVKQIL